MRFKILIAGLNFVVTLVTFTIIYRSSLVYSHLFKNSINLQEKKKRKKNEQRLAYTNNRY